MTKCNWSAARANRAELEARNAVHRRFGFDPDASVRFVLEQALPLRGRVLDVGTGRGRFVVPLARRATNITITTVDVNGEDQHRARLEATLAGVIRIRPVVSPTGGRVCNTRVLPCVASSLATRRFWWRDVPRLDPACGDLTRHLPFPDRHVRGPGPRHFGGCRPHDRGRHHQQSADPAESLDVPLHYLKRHRAPDSLRGFDLSTGLCAMPFSTVVQAQGPTLNGTRRTIGEHAVAFQTGEFAGEAQAGAMFEGLGHGRKGQLELLTARGDGQERLALENAIR